MKGGRLTRIYLEQMDFLESPIIKMSNEEALHFTKEIQMAVKSAKKVGRPANSATAEVKANPNMKPIVIHLHKKLHARFKLTANILGMTVNDAARELFAQFVNTNAKKILKAVSEDIKADAGDEDEDETTAVVADEDEDTDDDEDEDE